jgi:hypothetical protein
MMRTNFKRTLGLIILATATVALPSQALAYTCQDLENAQVALDGAIGSYQSANIQGRQNEAWWQWYRCEGSAGSADAKYWCDQEYQDTLQSLYAEEMDHLLVISQAEGELRNINDQLLSEGIVCT